MTIFRFNFSYFEKFLDMHCGIELTSWLQYKSYLVLDVAASELGVRSESRGTPRAGCLPDAGD